MMLMFLKEGTKKLEAMIVRLIGCMQVWLDFFNSKKIGVTERRSPAQVYALLQGYQVIPGSL